MKLKKIASLALAGVMAVSMLAGCGTDSSNNGSSNNDTATVSSIVDALNNGQKSTNKAKVTFTADSKLETAAKTVVAMHNDGYGVSVFPSNYYESEIAQYAAIVETVADADNFYKNAAADGAQPDAKDGEKNVYFNVIHVGSSAASETYWMNIALDEINKDIAKLDDTTKVTEEEATGTWASAQTGKNDPYFDFTYTGTACLYSAPSSTGRTDYYVAYTITQTVAEKTLK